MERGVGKRRRGVEAADVLESAGRVLPGVAKCSRSVSEEGRGFKAVDVVATIVASTQTAS